MSLVCWSGGCDSTLVLYEQAARTKKHEVVRAVSINHSQVPAIESSKRARKALLARFREMGFFIDHAEVTVNSEGDFFVGGDGGMFQAPFWLAVASGYLRMGDHLYMGYVREDDFWHYRSWAHQIFDAVKVFMHTDGELKYPLEWTTKAEVIRKLKALNLLDLCWWCEDGEKERIVPCGKCNSCLRHNNALAQIEREDAKKVLIPSA